MTPGFTIWLTGLSGAGKSTIAEALSAALTASGRNVEVLDGDVVRTHLSKGLGFSREDRDTNVRRIGWVCDLVARHGGVAIAAAISPFRSARADVRAATERFFEVFVDCPLETCIDRDVKGLYAKALSGEIANFTGVSDPYEAPLDPELVVHTAAETLADSVARIIAALEQRGYLQPAVALAGGV